MSKDSDIALAFKERREAQKEKKRSNAEYSTKLLIDKGVDFESKNFGFHLVVTVRDKIWDFWPSTGKFKRRDKKPYRRGVHKLIGEISDARNNDG